MGFLHDIAPAIFPASKPSLSLEEQKTLALVAFKREQFDGYPTNVAGGGLLPIRMDLKRSGLGTVGEQFGGRGYGIYFKRAGSLPNAKFTVDLGSRVENFSPGQTLRGTFDKLTLIRSSAEPAGDAGQFFAEFLIFTSPAADYSELQVLQPGSYRSAFLLNGVSVAEGAHYTDAEEVAGSFDARGWRLLRVNPYWVGAVGVKTIRAWSWDQQLEAYLLSPTTYPVEALYAAGGTALDASFVLPIYGAHRMLFAGDTGMGDISFNVWGLE